MYLLPTGIQVDYFVQNIIIVIDVIDKHVITKTIYDIIHEK